MFSQMKLKINTFTGLFFSDRIDDLFFAFTIKAE